MKKPANAAERKTAEIATNRLGKVGIRKLPSGVRGLDDILGGGIPEYSFNVIAASPGCGKTTMAHQIVFANATSEKPALYFTVLGEPTLKMRRYQQQFSFFDAEILDAVERVGAKRQVIDSLVGFEMALAPGFREDFREYVTTEKGVVVIGPRQTDYAGLSSGIPQRIGQNVEAPPEPKALRSTS